MTSCFIWSCSLATQSRYKLNLIAGINQLFYVSLLHKELVCTCYEKAWSQFRFCISSLLEDKIRVKVNVCLIAVAEVQIQQSQRWARSGRSWLLCTALCNYLCMVFHSPQLRNPDADIFDLARFSDSLESSKVTAEHTALCLDQS